MDSTNMYMPVAPANGFGGGDFGASGWWIILLFLFAGGFGGFGGYGNNAGGFVNADIQRGFDQNAVMTGMSNVQNGITSGFGDLQTALCGGFAGVNANIANGFAQAEIGENARQMANMNQMFALQTSIGNGVRDIIASQTASTERILSTLCQNEIDTLKGQVVSLQNQLNMANLAASQVAQTQQIITALTPAGA